MGSRTRVKVVKNKVAPPFRQCEFDIMYGKGISKEGSLIDVGVDLEIVKKSGAWFTYEGEQLGQGRENARSFLAEHSEIRDEIERKVREAVGLIPAFGDEGDETPIEIVPDLVLDDAERAEGPGQGEGQGQGATRRPSPWSRSRAAKEPKSCHERALGLLAVRAAQPPGARAAAPAAGFEADEVADVLGGSSASASSTTRTSPGSSPSSSSCTSVRDGGPSRAP